MQLDHVSVIRVDLGRFTVIMVPSASCSMRTTNRASIANSSMRDQCRAIFHTPHLFVETVPRPLNPATVVIYHHAIFYQDRLRASILFGFLPISLLHSCYFWQLLGWQLPLEKWQQSANNTSHEAVPILNVGQCGCLSRHRIFY